MVPLAPAAGGWTLDWDGRAPLALPDGGLLQIDGINANLPLRVCPRAGGERIAIAAAPRPRSAKQALRELGVPPWVRARAPMLWHGDALWAVGDLLLAGPFVDWLRAHSARFCWARAR
jgi:tRNA(Ile)-lysidine synthase